MELENLLLKLKGRGICFILKFNSFHNFVAIPITYAMARFGLVLFCRSNDSLHLWKFDTLFQEQFE